MVRITEQIVRKKSEHNEGEICSLEELSLHQEDIEKIEHLQNWCKNIQILLLQGNIISKIENLHKLKCLKYLNLALNNIEVIENLEKCESLEKLDLTLNFIGQIESVCSLKHNINLRDLYLTGNPCTKFKEYRYYVIAKLPQLTNLDNTDVTRTERFKALRVLKNIEAGILTEQKKYENFRVDQKIRLCNQPVVDDEEFWKQKTENSPEVRVEIAKRIKKQKNTENTVDKETKTVKLFTENGKPLNVNQAKVKFKLDYDSHSEIVLEVEIYKFLDTSLLDVDVQPKYVKVSIKGKIFQVVLPEKICTDKSIAQRSQTTGHLLITMPKLNVTIKKVEKLPSLPEPVKEKQQNGISKRQLLEIGPDNDRLHEIFTIFDNDFIDNPEVPPLE